MWLPHLLLIVLAFRSSAAFWPFSEDVKNGTSSDSSGYFNQCLDLYKCDFCYKIKEEGKCSTHTHNCRKTCTGCKGPDNDRYGTEKCQDYKSKGFCKYLSFKSFKCQTTCGTCAVDGNWSEWSKWSTCTKTCKQGKQSRKRECNSPAAQYGGKKCQGGPSEHQACNENVPCPVNGNWGEWSNWSTCTKTCKQGTQSRKRECDSPAAQYGGKKCDGQPSETQACNQKVPCPVDGNWGEWSQWSTCTKTCKYGKQYRKRECNSPASKYGGKKCVGQPSEAQSCNEKVPCPVNGNWGEWSQWSTCTKTCKQGRHTRSRKCDSPAPQYGGEKCGGYSSQTKVCNENINCPVNGNWGEWSEWSTCTKSCKQGKQSRKRECNSPAPKYGGKTCDGDSSEYQVCNEKIPCPVDGNWGKWSAWSACTKACKHGKQSRKRTCDAPAPLYGGKKCEGDSSEDQVCNDNVPCPVNGNWGQWSSWSTCSKTCKEGKQSRKRYCNAPAPRYGGEKCKGDSSESQVCNQDVNCPVEGNWGEWTAWSTCSKTCKQGKHMRSRKCDSPASQYGGKKCQGESSESQACNEKSTEIGENGVGGVLAPRSANRENNQGKENVTHQLHSMAAIKKCEGGPTETQACNQKVPCPVDGNWGGWSEWSTCTKTCKQGKQSRKRECNSPAPQYGGKKCQGDPNEYQVCNEKVPCPVDGNWGKWSEWSTCTKTCKQGKRSRKRECNSPAPLYGGTKCDGISSQDQACNENVNCPVDGNWGEWGAWSKCSKSCGGGEHTRVRQCNSPAPAYGGKPCEGPFRQRRLCNKENCPVDGNWSEWSEWSTCSKTCKQGKHSRSRKCDSPAPKYGGKKCQGESSEIQTCNEKVPCPVDGMWGSWNSWSPCSTTCGYGTRERRRLCDNPKPAYDGKNCLGVGYQKRRCHAYYPCPINGNWSDWGAWSPCTKTCGLSYKKRSRSCTEPSPQYGGSGCDGTNEQVERCVGKDCPAPAY